MQSVPVAKIKQQCLALLDRLEPDGIIIMKHGKPIAKLVPAYTDNAKLIGGFNGKIKGTILTTGMKRVTRDRRVRRSKRVPFAV